MESCGILQRNFNFRYLAKLERSIPQFKLLNIKLFLITYWKFAAAFPLKCLVLFVHFESY